MISELIFSLSLLFLIQLSIQEGRKNLLLAVTLNILKVLNNGWRRTLRSLLIAICRKRHAHSPYYEPQRDTLILPFSGIRLHNTLLF